MTIFFEKTKAMPIHEKVLVTETKEEEVIALNLKHKCPKCDRSFPALRGMQVHRGRFCDKRRRPRSRKGTLADKAVQLAKRKEEQSKRTPVTVHGYPIECVYFFIYLGSLLTVMTKRMSPIEHCSICLQLTLAHMERSPPPPIHENSPLCICGMLHVHPRV